MSNNSAGGFSFNVSQNPPNVNNNQKNEDDFEEVKEGNTSNQPQDQKKSGLSSLLDAKLVNLDSLGPKKSNRNANDFNNYW